MHPLPVLPEPGQLIAGKYRIVRRLGDGGMATVFEAEHEGLGTRVALKVLHPRWHRFSKLIDRFLAEARIMARIRSPQVVQVLDVDQEPGGLSFIVLELLDGVTLRAFRDAAPERRLAPPEALGLIAQLCEGLGAVHAAGIVHRDLKPENLMICRGPGGALRLVLLDFGIALREGAASAWHGGGEGAVLGTPEYMAPEQLSSADAVDLRADVFSAGVMLYELLAGRLPVSGEPARAIAARHIEGQIPRLGAVCPALPCDIVNIVERAMAPRANDRFESAAALAEALSPWIPLSAPASDDRSPEVPPVSVPTAVPDPEEETPTRIEAPWFTVDPGPSKPPAEAHGSSWRARLALGSAVLCAGLGASLLIGSMPHVRATGATVGRAGLAEAMLAAPQTEVAADPPLVAAAPEAAPTPAPLVEKKAAPVKQAAVTAPRKAVAAKEPPPAPGGVRPVVTACHPKEAGPPAELVFATPPPPRLEVLNDRWGSSQGRGR